MQSLSFGTGLRHLTEYTEVEGELEELSYKMKKLSTQRDGWLQFRRRCAKKWHRLAERTIDDLNTQLEPLVDRYWSLVQTH